MTHIRCDSRSNHDTHITKIGGSMVHFLVLKVSHRPKFGVKVRRCEVGEGAVEGQAVSGRTP